MKTLYILLPVLGVFLLSCADDDIPIDTPPEPPVFTAGSADFSTYVALGNSLTAGFSDNALFIDGQEASLPNMLASNFALVGGGTFNIPFMNDNLGGATIGGQTDLNQDGIPDIGNRLILNLIGDSPTPVPVEGQGSTEMTTKLLEGPYNNMGLPGAKSFELLAQGYGSVAGLTSGTANPYFTRFSSSEQATVLGDAVAQQPTFFSLWIGANDILAYATGGGTGISQIGNLNPSTYNRNDITDPNVLAGAIDAILQAMTADGAKGVIANLPNIIDIPFFTTVPHNPVPLDAPTAALLNINYATYNFGVGASGIDDDEKVKRTITFTAGEGNAVVIVDEDLSDIVGLPKLRQATADDLLVLTASTFIGSLANPSDPNSINGLVLPLEDEWVLTPEEQKLIKDTIELYNQSIASLANQYDLALVNANGLLSELNSNGFPLQNGVVTSEFATGGGFSLDGVHPSPRGYAILALEFIEAINEKYGSNLPGVDPLDFTGLYID